ncbi:MAG: hypothetical protein H6735_19365 [Alphaproteobacteria bacterium]|nr:hypothetical protein [Alphaproteobacteria bacterium]
MSAWDTCRVCPRLCRDGCPVATGSAREAAVPTWIATTLHGWQAGTVSAEDAAASATLCTDCGACQEHCHLHRPVPELLRDARRQLVPAPAMTPLRGVDGAAQVVAVCADERDLAAVLESRLGQPVARLRTDDALGVAAIEHPSFDARASELRDRLAGRVVAVVDGGVARALVGARVAFRWAWDLVGDPAPDMVGSCATGGPRPLACCGAAGPLRRHHPEDAARVARLFAQRGDVERVADACCGEHLGWAGVSVRDWLDEALEALA